MSTEESIIRLFCMVDDRLGAVNKRSDAKLYDREIVTIGMLFSMRGGQYRPFLSLAGGKLPLSVPGDARTHPVIAVTQTVQPLHR